MSYWSGTGVVEVLTLLVILLSVQALVRRSGALQRLAMPPVLLAGFVALGLSDGGLGLVHLDAHVLEVIVYHSLAVVFIGMGLAGGDPRDRAPGSLSVAFAIPLISMAQATLGLLVVLAAALLGAQLHPGLGLMLPLGFAQGPGQALSMGKAWEPLGFTSGAQAGLTLAALGFVGCSLAGVALVHAGRRLGWIDPPAAPSSGGAPGGPSAADRGDAPSASAAGTTPDTEPLTSAVAQVGAVYFLAWGLIALVATRLADKAALVAMLWGFHYLVGLLAANAARAGAQRLGLAAHLRPELLRRVAGLAVDVGAIAAIAAVRVDRLEGLGLPIAVLAVLGLGMTVLVCVWLGRRAFPDRPFEHALALFGTMTGTLPTGLALLRLVDPELKGPATRNMVSGITGATAFGAPILLVIMPMPVVGWPESFPGRTWATVGLCVAYSAVLIGLWWRSGALHLRGPLRELWPRDPADAPGPAPARIGAGPEAR
jgi:ESS family glutamate:Na+ symporter